MRTKILELMDSKGLKKAQVARDLDFSQQHIDNIIKEKQDGSHKFWRKFQEVYKIADEDIDAYKKGE